MKVYRTELTPVSFLRRSAAMFPERVAVVHGARRYSYRELAERVNRLASALRAAGLGTHERVALLSPNTPAMLEGLFGVPAAGGIVVPINTRLAAAEVGYILGHCGARFLFVDAELLPMVEPLDLSGLRVVRIDDNGLSSDPYEQFLASGHPEEPESRLEDEEEPFSLSYTSGTTGQPKGVLYSHRGAYLNGLGEVIEAGLASDSVYLWVLPMFHCTGWGFPWGVTAVGGTHVCLRRVDPPRIWELLESEGVTHYCGAPTVQISLVNHPVARRLARRVTVMVGGAPPSPTLIAQMDALNLHPIHLYGLTESYGPITVCEWHPEWDVLDAEERARLMARQGQAYVIADLVRVVDGEMHDVPRDGQTMGEVVMRGNDVMLGYFEQPAATDEAFRGGWFHSGDLGVWHLDGYVELRDRAKDVIISGGENISTIEVEQALARHPAVLEAAVVAVPHDLWGERPKAFVTLKPGMAASEAELITFCRERLAHFKCPDAIGFEELPKTSTGKVQKFVLREREWAGYDRRIH
ncbi:MAG TPA: acyl--CoA ligase family protein [Thermomicrobiaceae bacterium]|nr:acyl--CoA ligase family protein [Thermomicrobiaceae bacterium]